MKWKGLFLFVVSFIIICLFSVSVNASLDFIAGNYNQANQVYLNDGDGTFTASESYGNSRTKSIAVGDFDGDGYTDYIEGNGRDGANQVYLNDGDGTFTASESYGDSRTKSIAVGDFDGDGYTDYISGNVFDGNQVYLNDGDGTFTAGESYSRPTNTYSIAVGDFDGDGYTDFIAGNGDDEVSQVYLNDGDGTFTAGESYGGFMYAWEDIAVGDFDGDGYTDFIAGIFRTPNQVYLNDGDGTFTAGDNHGDFYTMGLAVGDFDGDGYTDYIEANGDYPGEPNQIYLNNGDGTFTAGESYGDSSSSSVAVGDFDGDGYTDFIVGNDFGVANQVYLNDGDGTFTAGESYGSSSSLSVAVGDFDGPSATCGDGTVQSPNDNGINEKCDPGTGNFGGTHCIETGDNKCTCEEGYVPDGNGGCEKNCEYIENGQFNIDDMSMWDRIQSGSCIGSGGCGIGGGVLGCGVVCQEYGITIGAEKEIDIPQNNPVLEFDYNCGAVGASPGGAYSKVVVEGADIMLCTDDNNPESEGHKTVSLTGYEGQAINLKVLATAVAPSGVGDSSTEVEIDNIEICGDSGETCTSYSYTQCYDDDLYWYDSCDVREEKSEECGPCGCSGGVCQTPDNYGESCTVGVGQCKNTGTIECDETCSVIPNAASKEVCDGKDNDCDGKIDNNLNLPQNDKQEGVCSGSTKTCDGSNGWINDYTSISD
ncbi:MAG: FG-GAP repeat domain-containing protein, partial [Nanobdellota archaeon]